MKRNVFFLIAMMAMMMASVNADARGRVVRGRRGDYREVRMSHRAPAPAMHRHHAVPLAHHVGRPMHHYVDARGFLPGWEGRVRYHGGRWGYLRDSRWYWYDTYFAPDYYYGHPVAHFHSHICAADVAPVVGGVAAGIAVGALINALMH